MTESNQIELFAPGSGLSKIAKSGSSVVRIRSPRGIRIVALQLVLRTGEIEEYRFDQANFTVISGPRNSSKSTTLKLIDYCLGDRDSPHQAVGRVIADKYADVTLYFTLNGAAHSVRRSFTRGDFSRLYVDDEEEFSPQEFSDWILRMLGWPRLQIPLGRSGSTAPRMVPLTLRTLMRHIYRKESSWLDFASKEYDYNRVAVTSYFLGLASMRYDRESRSFAIAEADRELLGVEAILRDVNTTTEETVTTICEQLGLPLVSRPADLVTLRTALQNELANLSQQRNNIIEGQYEVGPDFSSAVSPVGYDSTLTERYEAVSVDLQRAVEVVADLRIVVREHEQSLRLVEADRGRLNRLLGAVEVFDDLPVRMCPACEQDVSPNRDHDSGSCYLCFQPVIEDRRRRRAEMEMRALDSEVREINEAQARAERDLANATASEERLRQKQTDLANELNNTRAAQLAPFMAALEDVASQSAKINQQLAALPAIEQVLTRQHHAQIRVDEAARTVDETASIQVDEATYIRESRRRCANLADRMNEFLSNFRGRGWVGSEVTVSAQELTFYVGTRTWEEQLGAEARVLFFLAYSYALLALTQDLGEEGNAPGLLIMDNPYQHDLNDDVVRESLELIGNLAASNGTQLITTQSRSASDIRSPHAEIIMQNEYTFDQEDE